MSSQEQFMNYLKSSLSKKLKEHLMKDSDLIKYDSCDLQELISARTDIILSGDIDFNMNEKRKVSGNCCTNPPPSRAVSPKDKKIINDIIKNNISFILPQENLKRKGTEAYDYYEKYKKATNYTEWIDYGGLRHHFVYEYRKGMIKTILKESGIEYKLPVSPERIQKLNEERNTLRTMIC